MWKKVGDTQQYLRRTRKLLETKLSSRNLIKRIKTWAVPLVKYSEPFLKWTKEKLKQMDQRTRKLKIMYKALYPRYDVDRLYVSRKEGGRGFTRTEDSVDASIQRYKDYIKNAEGNWLQRSEIIVGWVLWHINPCRSFNAKFCLYIHTYSTKDFKTNIKVGRIFY